MRFIVLLIAGYVYFSFALLNSFQNFSYYNATVSNSFGMQKAESKKAKVPQVTMAKTGFFHEKSGLSL